MFRYLRVLLVASDPAAAQLADRLLSADGHTLIRAESLEHASSLMDDGVELIIHAVAGDDGLALVGGRAEDVIADFARYPAENPNPVMRIAKGGTIVHANDASDALLRAAGAASGQQAPERWRDAVAAAPDSSQPQSIDASIGDRVVALSVVPVPERSYANIYGRDVTEQRAAQERAEHLQNVLRALRNISRLIASEHDVQGLVQQACRTLVESRGYHDAWIAVAPGANPGWSVASATSSAALDQLTSSLAAGEIPACCQQALDASRGVARYDAGSHGDGCPLSDAHADRGLNLVALHHDGHNFGLLGFTSRLALDSDDEELELIVDVASELGLAIRNLEVEAQRRKSEERYQFLFTNMLEGYAHCRMIYRDGVAEDYVHVDVNEAFESLTGLKDAVGRRVTELIPGIRESNPELFEIYGRVATTGTPERFETYVEPLRSWFSVAVYSPGPEHFVAVFDNITERKRAVEALKQSEQRYRLLAENASDVIWTTDLSLRVTYVSPSVERVLGFTADEVMALPSVEPLLSDASMADANQTLAEELQARDNGGLSSYQERTVESEVVRRDGTTAWVESKFAVLDGADGKPAQLLGVTRDISDKRTLQASVAQADRLANMGMLASGVAHEINNPLSYVLYNLESVLEDWPTGESDDLQDQLREALDGTKRITQIARALGTFSRVEPIHVEEIDLQAPLEHALRMAHNELKYRAKVTRDFKSIPAVFASEGRLAQVFLNLLINAAHAIGEGDVSRHEVKVSTWAQGDRVFAAVSDTGGGIAPEHAERIFEPFFSTKGIGTGSGLGLAICRNIVEGFGGTISFESQLGKGTRFVIALPHRVPDVAATPATDEPPASVPERIRILVVDDERPIRRILTRMLGRDHTVVLASSGEEACSILEEDSNFQVILCDLMMPHMSGTDLHQTLRQSAPELAGRIVFMTGGAFTPTTQAYLARFDNRRVDKPFRAEDVRRAVNNVAVGRTTASSAPPE